MAHQSEYDFLFKVSRAGSPGSGAERFDCGEAIDDQGPLTVPRAPSCASSPQLLLIGDSGVGKSCLLLRFAVSGSPPFSGRNRRTRLQPGRILVVSACDGLPCRTTRTQRATFPPSAWTL